MCARLSVFLCTKARKSVHGREGRARALLTNRTVLRCFVLDPFLIMAIIYMVIQNMLFVFKDRPNVCLFCCNS